MTGKAKDANTQTHKGSGSTNQRREREYIIIDKTEDIEAIKKHCVL